MQSNLQEALDAVTCHQPARLQHEFQANTGLVRRLSHTQSLRGHSSSVSGLDWSSNGELLLSGSDDCRVKLWSPETGRAVQSFDSVRLLFVAPRQGMHKQHLPCAGKAIASCTYCVLTDIHFHTYVQGHTSSIYAVKFMPSTGNEQIITSAADRQVRQSVIQTLQDILLSRYIVNTYLLTHCYCYCRLGSLTCSAVP